MSCLAFVAWSTRWSSSPSRGPDASGLQRPIGKIPATFRSFSAVSAPIFARKYAFCSIVHNLQEYLAEFFESWQNFANLNLQDFAGCCYFHENCWFFKPIFCENFEIAAVQKYANLVELEKCCRTHIFLQNFVLIQPRTSPPKICKLLLIFPILLTLTPRTRASPWSRRGPPARSSRSSRPGTCRSPRARRRRAGTRRAPASASSSPGRAGARRGLRQTLEGSFSAVSKPNFASK